MVNYFKENSCCVIGHRKINEDISLFEQKLKNIFIDLIDSKQVEIFNFGNYGEFNDLCYKLLSLLKVKYKNIKLVLFSLNNEMAFTFEEAEHYKIKYEKQNKIFPYKCFNEIIYLNDIDETKFKYACVLRNKKLIDESDFCLFYYKENYSLPVKNNMFRNSGTKIAYDYAKIINKKIILI